MRAYIIKHLSSTTEEKLCLQKNVYKNTILDKPGLRKKKKKFVSKMQGLKDSWV